MPTTEAGKRLLDRLEEFAYETRDELRPVIDTIEAEAREDEFDKGWSKGKAWGEKQERARIRAAVERLGRGDMYRSGWRAAVLAVIDR